MSKPSVRRLDTQKLTNDNEAPHGLVVVSRARLSQQAAAILGAAQTMASALDGITVLDLTDGPAGALTTMFLCDHGARVIRVVDSSGYQASFCPAEIRLGLDDDGDVVQEQKVASAAFPPGRHWPTAFCCRRPRSSPPSPWVAWR